VPSRNLKVAVTEWNTTAGDWGLARASLLTLGNALACARYHNLMQHNADLVEIANRSNLVDSFGSGIIQTGPGWLYLTPTYYAQQLYSRAAGSFPLDLKDHSGIPWPLQEPDLSATLSADGRTLRIYGVNSTDKAIEVPFAFRGGKIGRATALILRDRDSAATREVVNTRADPQRVSTRTEAVNVGAGEFRYTFAAFSVTVLEVEVEPSHP